MRYLLHCCTSVAVIGMLAAVSLADQPRKVTIGAPQIFVDLEAAVESTENVQQIFHTAQKHPKNPVLRWEKPWETKTGTPTAPVIYDEREKLFKCWYFGIPSTIEGQPIWGPHLQCYATSQDGVHWAQVTCAMMAGGGMATGQVLGATNRYGEYVTERPVSFQEIFATLYHHLGIDIQSATVTDLNGRPQYLLDSGVRPIDELS